MIIKLLTKTDIILRLLLELFFQFHPSIHPCSRFLLEKLTGFQLVKKFPAFYRTRKFITAFTFARHLSLSRVNSIQSIPPHPTSWRSILILSSHLRLVRPSGLFPSGFPTKTLYTPLLSHIRAISPAHLLLLYHPNNIGWGIQISQLVIGQLSSLLCYLVPPRPKYSSQHPILKHPQPVFIPQCQRPSFSPIEHNRYNYNSVYLNL